MTAYLSPGQRRVTGAPPWEAVTAKRAALHTAEMGDGGHGCG